MKHKGAKIKIFIWLVLIGAVFIGMARYTLYEVLFPKKYSETVEKYSQRYLLDDNFVYAVIKAESNFTVDVTSHKEAMGLMQITPETGQWAAEMIGIENYTTDMLHEPDTNICIGCWYLERLINQYGNRDTAVAAYNAGSGNVNKWIEENADGSLELDRETIPFEETKNYVERVNRYYKIYNFLYENKE